MTQNCSCFPSLLQQHMSTTLILKLFLSYNNSYKVTDAIKTLFLIKMILFNPQVDGVSAACLKPRK